MTRDVKLIQRGVNVQANDMAVPPGTPLRAVNIDYQRDGVAQRRVGFESFYTGLPPYPWDNGYSICEDIPEVIQNKASFELAGRELSVMISGGFPFGYSELKEFWTSIPTTMPHRITFFGDNHNSEFACGIGRSVVTSNSVTCPLRWQIEGENQSIVGAIGNSVSQASLTAPLFYQPFDHCKGYTSDYNTIRTVYGALLAGSLTVTGSTNGTGAAATFLNASWMTTDGTDIYVADNTNQIRKVTTGGVVTLFAGSTTSGSTNAVGSAARFSNIQGLAYTAGFIYVADYGNSLIRKCDVTTGSVTTLASSASNPSGLEFIGSYLYYSQGAYTISRVNLSGTKSDVIGYNWSPLSPSGMVGGASSGDPYKQARLGANPVIRGKYTAPGVPAGGSYLIVECANDVSGTIDIGLVYVDDALSSPYLNHIIRCPSGYPNGINGPNKMDTVGPSMFANNIPRIVDAGNGIIATTNQRPRAIDSQIFKEYDKALQPFRTVGISAPEAPSFTAIAGSGFAQSTAWAYRTVCGVNLTDGRIAIGPPSERLTVIGSTTATCSASVTAFPSPDLTYNGSAFIQVYRTKTVANTLDPGDQMFLCYEQALTYGEGVSFTDALPDTLLGAELYTNVTSDGVGATASPPPYFCNDVASFGGSVVFGNFIEPATAKIKLLGAASLVANTSTVTLTANIFTVSSTYSAFGARTFTAIAGITNPLLNQFQIGTGGTATQNTVQTAKNLAMCINRSPTAMWFTASYDESDPGVVIVTLVYPGITACKDAIFALVGFSPGEAGPDPVEYLDYQASITPTTNISTAFLLSNYPSTRNVCGLAVSDQNTNDSFPAVARYNVGSNAEAIQRLLPISDTLLVVKDDSVWRTDANYVPQIYDTALSCSTPNSFARINNQWIGLFTRGFVALNSSSAVAIGRNIDRDVVAVYDQLIGSLTAPFASASSIDATGNYLCTVNQKTYCYNAIAQAWSEWQINAVAQQYPGGEFDTDGQTSGMMTVGAYRDCFIASQDASRSVSRQRDYSRTSTDWYKSFADFSYTMSGTISDDLQTITATLVIASNPGVYAPRIWSPPPGAVADVNNTAAKFYWAFEVTKDATLELAQGVLTQGDGSASQVLTVTLAEPLTTLTAGVVASLVAYPPIICRVQYAPSVSPGSDAMFGDMLVTVERAQPGWLIARFFNRNDFGDATVPADGDYLDTYGVSRANLMPSITVSNSSGLGGLYNYHDPQRFFVPSERVSDQVLGVELWEGNAWQPFAIKSVSPDKRVKENVKVTR